MKKYIFKKKLKKWLVKNFVDNFSVKQTINCWGFLGGAIMVHIT